MEIRSIRVLALALGSTLALTCLDMAGCAQSEATDDPTPDAAVKPHDAAVADVTIDHGYGNPVDSSVPTPTADGAPVDPGGQADGGLDASIAPDAADAAPAIDAADAADAADTAVPPIDASADATADAIADGATDDGAITDAAPDAATDASCALGCGAQSSCVVGACIPSRRVFVSSQSFTGNLGGHGGADDSCQSLATAAGLGGSWKAWVSDSTSSPSARFAQAAVGYRLVDGTLVAADWSGLTSGTLAHAISLDEHGTVVAGSEVWTGTNASGTSAGSGCVDFSSAAHTASYAAVGVNDKTTSSWSDTYLQFCDRTNPRLYCVEQ